MYKAPKTIIKHPGVETCESAMSSGIDNEYKHDVWLKEGWCWNNGRTKGCRGGHFRRVKDFIYAEPVKITS